MKIDNGELLKLRGALLAFILLVAAGAATLYFAELEKNRAKRELSAAEARRNQAESRLRLVRNEENEIKEKGSLFQDLVARGIVGQENRLEWIELLREIRDRRKIFAVDYEISPQQSLGTTASGHDFRASDMRIKASLLHEAEFLGVLDEIRQNARALVLPRQCSVSRIALDGSVETGGTQGQIAAECTLQWITVRAPEKKS